MKPGDLVKLERLNGKYRLGYFIKYQQYLVYAEIFWYDEMIINIIRADLLEVINEAR